LYLKKQKCGIISFKTRFIYMDPRVAIPKVNPNAMNSLWKGMSAGFNMKMVQSEGIKTAMMLKT
jgi:hypothetical protein